MLLDGEDPGKLLTMEETIGESGLAKGSEQSIVITGHRWKQELANTPVDCGPGHAITYLAVKEGGMEVQCSAIAGIGGCAELATGKKDIKTQGIGALEQMPMSCGGDFVLKSFRFEFEENMGNFAYECCQVGGVPIAMEPIQVHRASLQTYAGVYCPVHVTALGRINYEQLSEEDSYSRYHWAAQGDAKFAPAVQFSESTGEWCVKMRIQLAASVAQTVGMHDHSVTAKTWFCIDRHDALPFGLYSEDVGFTMVTAFDGDYKGGLNNWLSIIVQNLGFGHHHLFWFFRWRRIKNRNGFGRGSSANAQTTNRAQTSSPNQDAHNEGIRPHGSGLRGCL